MPIRGPMIIRLPNGRVVVSNMGGFGQYRPIRMPAVAESMQSRKAMQKIHLDFGVEVSKKAKRQAEIRRRLAAQPICDLVPNWP